MLYFACFINHLSGSPYLKYISTFKSHYTNYISSSKSNFPLKTIAYMPLNYYPHKINKKHSLYNN